MTKASKQKMLLELDLLDALIDQVTFGLECEALEEEIEQMPDEAIDDIFRNEDPRLILPAASTQDSLVQSSTGPVSTTSVNHARDKAALVEFHDAGRRVAVDATRSAIAQPPVDGTYRIIAKVVCPMHRLTPLVMSSQGMLGTEPEGDNWDKTVLGRSASLSELFTSEEVNAHLPWAGPTMRVIMADDGTEGRSQWSFTANIDRRAGGGGGEGEGGGGSRLRLRIEDGEGRMAEVCLTQRLRTGVVEGEELTGPIGDLHLVASIETTA